MSLVGPTNQTIIQQTIFKWWYLIRGANREHYRPQAGTSDTGRSRPIAHKGGVLFECCVEHSCKKIRAKTKKTCCIEMMQYLCESAKTLRRKRSENSTGNGTMWMYAVIHRSVPEPLQWKCASWHDKNTHKAIRWRRKAICTKTFSILTLYVIAPTENLCGGCR